MDEWTGKLTRADAIRIIENFTDKDDPAWEYGERSRPACHAGAPCTPGG